MKKHRRAVLPLIGLLLSAGTGSAAGLQAPDSDSSVYSIRIGSELPDTGLSNPDSVTRPAPHQPALRWYDMFARIPGDWVRWSHATFKDENIVPTLGIAALTWALIVTDEDTWRASDKEYRRSPVVKTWSDLFTKMGDGRTQFGMGGAFGLYGWLAHDERALRTGSQIVEAVLASGTVVQVLKHITGRQSPFVSTRRGGVWDFFPNQIEYHKHVPRYDAYPSGHITTSTAVVVVIAENYPDSKWIEPVGYTLVGLIGIGMVDTGIHWYSDYPLGIALGYMFGMIAAHPGGIELGDAGASGHISMSLQPTPDGNGVGIGFSIRL